MPLRTPTILPCAEAYSRLPNFRVDHVKAPHETDARFDEAATHQKLPVRCGISGCSCPDTNIRSMDDKVIAPRQMTDVERTRKHRIKNHDGPHAVSKGLLNSSGGRSSDVRLLLLPQKPTCIREMMADSCLTGTRAYRDNTPDG